MNREVVGGFSVEVKPGSLPFKANVAYALSLEIVATPTP